jgi:two-component system, NtrC family, sensor kinase
LSTLDDLFTKFEEEPIKEKPKKERLNLLVVDDEKNIQDSLKLFFRDKYDVLVADTGEKGLEMIDENIFNFEAIIDFDSGELLNKPVSHFESSFSCVIMDAFLSKKGLDGFTTTKKIKQKFPHLPIVMLTGYHKEHRIQEVFEFGIDRYFEKPLSGDDKIQMFKDWIDKNSQLYQKHINIKILRNSEAKLKLENDDYRHNLELKVEQKTEELKKIQAKLMHADKMASIGTIAAGIAHEINNPAAAMRTGFNEEESLLYDLITNSHNYSRLIQQNPFLEKIVNQIINNESIFPINRNEIRKKEKSIKLVLDERDISLKYSKNLAYLGLEDNELETLLETSPDLDEDLSYLKKIYDLKSYRIGNKNCIKRILSITSSFKRYSHINQSPEKNINIIESIEDALVIHHNDLKYGVNVNREYDEQLPNISCYPQELGQVWTNLISNSIYAMNKKGDIDIKVKNLDDYIRVSFIDSGEGIKEEEMNKIFDAFYTTKKQSDGTGLGLNIVYNIIYEKHKGKIEVNSEPGRTEFNIYLPVNN